jgi:uncharacterized repeat protein (TIGR01451 family)
MHGKVAMVERRIEMRRTVRMLALAGLLAVVLMVPAGPTLGQAADPLVACAQIAFSTEEDFVTQGPGPPDGNPIISDGDLLGDDCVICRRNAELLEVFDVQEDLGLDAADVINVDAGLVAFSTELDSPHGGFTAGDLLTTHGAVIPNVALLHQFDLPRADLGLDALHFVGDMQGINRFLDFARTKGRADWIEDPDLLFGQLEEYKIDILFSTEGTGQSLKGAPLFLDGDLLSARDGNVVVENGVLLPNSVPAGLPKRGVDFGLDAVATARDGNWELIHFSTEILFRGEPAFTDGDVLKLGNGVSRKNANLVGCFEPKVGDLGLDALFLGMEQVELSGGGGLRAPWRPKLPPIFHTPEPAPPIPSSERAADVAANGEDGIVLHDLLAGASETISTGPMRWGMEPAVYGDAIVWSDRRNGNWDIYLYDYALGLETQLTSETHDQTQPAIYEDKVVYISEQNGNDDVYLFDLATWTVDPICTNAARQLSPDIYDDIVVWMDYRNGDYPDIYMYDLSTNTETAVKLHTAHYSPALYGNKFVSIHEDRIVWSDWSSGNSDIYLYDLSTDTEEQITTNTWHQGTPDIYEDIIVWMDQRNSPSSDPDLLEDDIYGYDLSTDTEFPISTAPDGFEATPSIYGDKVVWNKSWDIYMYDLTTDTETAIATDPGFDSMPHIHGHRIVWDGVVPTEPYVRLLFVPLNWTSTQAAFNSEVDTQVSFFRNAIPLSACPARLSVTTLNVTTQNFSTFNCTYPTNCGVGSIKPFVDSLGINTADYDAIVGVAPSSPCPPIAGCSNGADAVWVTTEYDIVTAHELGHIYGLEDEYCSNPAGSTDCRCNDGDQGECGDTGSDGAATGDLNWLDTSLGCDPDGTPCCDVIWGDCSAVNYGICCRGNQNTSGGRCVMSYADAPGPRDFCAHCRAHLATVPELSCSSPEPPESDQVVDLALNIYPDDAVEERRVILRKGRPTRQFEKGDTYRLSVASESGKLLWSQEFNVYFDYYGPFVSTEDYAAIRYEFFPFACKIPYKEGMHVLSLSHGRKIIYERTLDFCNRNGRCDPSETHLTCPEDCPLNEDDGICQPNDDGICDPDCAVGVDPDCTHEEPPMEACRKLAFSTEEDFFTEGPMPIDGVPIISDGDLLGENCTVCARNRQLLAPFKVEIDLGLDAADVIDVDTELVAFSTELDDPDGRFTAGDLLATNGVAIPNQALLWAFEIDYDMGLDAIYFVGHQDVVAGFLQNARDVTRGEWLEAPERLAERLKEAGIDLRFSTEGTAPPVEQPQFLDGDLLSVVNGTIVEPQQDLLPADVPAGIPSRGVDFGLDAVSADRSNEEEPLRFSTEILYHNDWSFTDGDVLLQGDHIEHTNLALISPCNAEADFLGLDAYSISPVTPCEPSIEVQKEVLDINGNWVDQTDAQLSDVVRFRCEIHNNGTCCDLSDMAVTDVLADNMAYVEGSATVDGEPREPDVIAGNEFTWFIRETQQPSDTITIEFEAHVTGCGPGENVQKATGVCEELGETVTAEDTATVIGVGKPDLVVSRITCDRLNDRIGYEVTNVGCDVAEEGHDTELSVDGSSFLDTVTEDLEHGETFEGWFNYAWPTCHTVDVEVCADVGNDVVEEDEMNNCRDGGCISAQLEWRWDSPRVKPGYDQVMMAPVAADLDGNEIPDVVFTTFTGTNWTSNGILRAIRGDTGTELFSVTSPNYRVKPGGGVAVADIDGDGKPEILANRHPAGVICFEHDGTDKWMTSAPSVGHGGVAVADLDEDGTPEIVARNTVLRNDGTVYWTGTGGGASAYPVVANLDMTGHPEVVSGNTAYRYDGTIYWRGTHYGNPAIANLDDDRYPEVVFVGGDRISIWDHDGMLKWGPMPVPGTGNGPPVIADMDGDGRPEIGVGGYDYYVAYEGDLSVKWMVDTRDYSSRATSSTAFDFDGDGAFEILYSDEHYHRILRGTDGAILFEVPGPSGTLLEHPFIVDVDNDGHAEMVAAVNNYAWGVNTGIEVYGNDTCWPDARNIWNQHTYHITNVTDNAKVPQVEANNWETHNNYRTQSPGVPSGEKPDLVIRHIECNRVEGHILYVVANAGDVTAPANHDTAVWINGTKICSDPVGVDLPPGGAYTGLCRYTWPAQCVDISVRACADHNEEVDEISETNNCASEECPCNRVYFRPPQSSTSYSQTTRVDIWVDADDFKAGQIKLAYSPACADVTDWTRNTSSFPMGTWDSDTSGEEWITFAAQQSLTGVHLVGTLTIHCENNGACATPLDFVVDGQGTSKLFDEFGGEVSVTWEDGDFECALGTCGDVAPYPGCDGLVNMGDVSLLHSYVGNPHTGAADEPSLCCEWCGDVAPYPGCDGRINMGDVSLLHSYVGHPGQYSLCCQASQPAIAQVSAGLMAADNDVSFAPQESSAAYDQTTEVEIEVTADSFKAGQMTFTYEPTCADVTGWTRNVSDFPTGEWESDMVGEETITIMADGPLTGTYSLGTLTIESQSQVPCTTTLEFVTAGAQASKLFDDWGSELSVTWVDGTFRGGVAMHGVYLPLVLRES